MAIKNFSYKNMSLKSLKQNISNLAITSLNHHFVSVFVGLK